MSAQTSGCTARCASARSTGSSASAQHYVHLDRNDYSLDPRLVGRRVEVRVSQREVVAVALGTGELAARHRRVFAAGQEITEPAHQQALERQRRTRYAGKPTAGEDVELRDLSVYDRLAA
jgi:hypothetical protein